MADKKKPNTTPKKLSNKDIRKARQAAKSSQERIPAGMSSKDYADATFRKKVTIIMCCILLVFVIGVVGVLLNAHLKTEKHNEEFQRIEDEFKIQSQAIKEQLAQIESNGGKPEDKASVKIEVTDENYSYWVRALDASYQLQESDPDYACYSGATIHVQGQFVKRVFTGDAVNYWLYRSHDDHAHGEDSDSADDVETTVADDESVQIKDTKIPLELLNDPIELKFDGDVTIPEDGAWVDVNGIIGIDSNNSLSAIHHTQMTVIPIPEHNHE